MKTKVKYKEGYSNFGCEGNEYPADENGEAEMSQEALAAAQGMGIVESFELFDEEDEEVVDPEDQKLFDILEGNLSQIEDALPALNAEQLARLQELENANADRKGVDALVKHALSKLEA